MIGPRSFQPSSESSNREEFDNLFVRRVHSIVLLGYQRLQPTAYSVEQEPTITGDLVDAMEKVLEEATESWMRFFRVHDDPPLNDSRKARAESSRRKGRSRRRIDIKIDSSDSSPYSRFHFEAKRLGKRHPVGGYLGSEGLGLFLGGDYAAKERRAGMLGYIQEDDETTWATKIEAKLLASISDYKVTRDGKWKKCPQSADLVHTYKTFHNRQGALGIIEIYHSLLRFN